MTCQSCDASACIEITIRSLHQPAKIQILHLCLFCFARTLDKTQPLINPWRFHFKSDPQAQ